MLGELLEAGFRILRRIFLTGSILLADLRCAWAKAETAITRGQIGTINKIKGIMSNLIFKLVSLAWLPLSFDRWIDPQGASWQLDKLDSPKGIIKQLVLSYDSQQCEPASKHTNGKGMENGVDWNSS